MNSKQKSDTIATPTGHHISEIQGLLILAVVALSFLCVQSFAIDQPQSNWLGVVGYLVGGLLYYCFGLGSYLLLIFLGWIGWSMVIGHPLQRAATKTFWFLCLLASWGILWNLIETHSSSLSHWFAPLMSTPSGWRLHLGGTPLYYLAYELPRFSLTNLLNPSGVVLLFSLTLLISFLQLTRIRVSPLLHFLRSKWHERKNKENGSLWRQVRLRLSSGTTDSASSDKENNLLKIRPRTDLRERPRLSRQEETTSQTPEKKSKLTGLFQRSSEVETEEEPKKTRKPNSTSKRDAALRAQRVYNGDLSDYRLPPLDDLTSPKQVDQTTLKADLRRQAEVLEETLQSFGIEATVGQINCGPTITSFEVHPSIGVKVQKIKALENDIALNMEARSIRIIAPIPGKAAVGIEVPNPKPQEVSFKEMLAQYRKGKQKARIPLLLGKSVSGENVISDLAKMPHCIIAGATGSGKSVCINTIVMSIVFNAKPDQVKLLMVDPKKVELTPYTKLPHMLAPVITEPTGACVALHWLVKEMEKRYELLKLCGVRNIEGFNHRKKDPHFEASLDRDVPDKMHYIVAIIDAFADLMMVSSHDIETPIARIAQMARAVGIHLILATQRPSREVITGIIKANFPTRISFKVSSRVNSQIVLDESGAETLLGNGDMLFLPPGSSTLIRAQGAFIRDEDINRVVEHVCEQLPTQYAIASFDTAESVEDFLGESDNTPPLDSLYAQARELVLKAQNASTTFLQRKLKIGYARAASLIDQLEDNEVIGPIEGGKGRQVLIQEEEPPSSTEDAKEALPPLGD